jgi:hypothetical protein
MINTVKLMEWQGMYFIQSVNVVACLIHILVSWLYSLYIRLNKKTRQCLPLAEAWQRDHSSGFWPWSKVYVGESLICGLHG